MTVWPAIVICTLIICSTVLIFFRQEDKNARQMKLDEQMHRERELYMKMEIAQLTGAPKEIEAKVEPPPTSAGTTRKPSALEISELMIDPWPARYGATKDTGVSGGYYGEPERQVDMSSWTKEEVEEYRRIMRPLD